VIEVDLPCGAVVRVLNDQSSLRRALGVLIEAGLVKLRRSDEETLA
jgi:ABC-type metal ion transport system substrate-binding protein